MLNMIPHYSLYAATLKESKRPCTYIAKWMCLVHDNIIPVNHTSFWNAHWIRTLPLNIAFPRLYALSGQKEATIAHSWNYDYQAWNLVWEDILMRLILKNGQICPLFFNHWPAPQQKTLGNGSLTSLAILLRNWSRLSLPLVATNNMPPFISIFREVASPRRSDSSCGKSVLVASTQRMSLKSPHGLHQPLIGVFYVVIMMSPLHTS